MDTSETYIKMCEKANIKLHCDQQTFYYCPEHKQICYYDDELQGVKCFRDWHDFHVQHDIGEVIFIVLPRQDQLQEMESGKSAISYFVDWPEWLIGVYGRNYGNKPNGHLGIFKTWEQLWLAFVMKEKYNKVWNGEDWILCNVTP